MTAPQTIRIVVAEDYDAVREGLVMSLELNPHFRVVGEAETGADAIRLCKELNPDIVLMDIRMPGIDGIMATRHLHQEMPLIRVIVLSGVTDPNQVLESIRAGACGFLVKDARIEELADVIERAYRTESCYSFESMQAIVEYARITINGLSPEAHEVLDLAKRGLTPHDIIVRLHIHERALQIDTNEIISRIKEQAGG